jgi:hypothetical protein
MSDQGFEYGETRSPTPYGRWEYSGNADAGSYWVEESAPENAGYAPTYSGGGDAGTNVIWNPVEPSAPTQQINYGNWETAQDRQRNEEIAKIVAAQQAQQAVAPVAPTVFRNPAATLNTSATQSPVFNPAQPYYQTTNDVQNQYAWSPRSAAQPLQQGIPNWGAQQPSAAFDVNRFITEMLGPKNQSQTATLPTPYPGR